MAENVLAMTLRMRNTAVTTTRNLKREVKSTGVAAQKMGTKFGKAVKASRTSVGGLMGSLVSLKTIIIATFAYRAIQRFGRFISSLTALFNMQEKSTMELSQAFAGWGRYTKEQISLLQQQAAAMQHVINVDNEEIESMMGLLASYGMNADQVKEAIGLTIDFSKAKRIELKAAVDLVGKAFVGYTGTLSRYGIILDKDLTLEEKYSATLRELSVFTGTAAALANTYAGEVGILAKAYDDLKKYLGEIIGKSIQYSGVLQMLGMHVKAATEKVQEYIPVMAAIGAVMVSEIAAGLHSLIEDIKGSGQEWLAWASTVANSVRFAFNALSVFIRAVSAGFQHLWQVGRGIVLTIKMIGMSFSHTFAEVKAAYIEGSIDIMQSMEDISEKMGKGMDKDTATAIKSAAAIRDAWKGAEAGTYLDDLAEKYKVMIARIKAAAQATRDSIVNRKQANDVMEDTIKITKGMAQQFALATRVEREQTKYLLQKISSMGIEDVGGLSELERKLISKQSVLKESYSGLFGEFAQRELGLEASFLKESKVNVEIDLTDDAKDLLKVSRIENERISHRNIERQAG